jgi:hypothetical protein
MLPASTKRVPTHTAEDINQKFQRQTEANITYFATIAPEAIDKRLEELDREWDIERALEANASSLALFGLAMGVSVSRKWFAFPAIITGFLLQHALQGWCPPLPLLRRLGFRTRSEIEHERYALKFLRKDFDGLHLSAQPGNREEVKKLFGAVTR